MLRLQHVDALTVGVAVLGLLHEGFQKIASFFDFGMATIFLAWCWNFFCRSEAAFQICADDLTRAVHEAAHVTPVDVVDVKGALEKLAEDDLIGEVRVDELLCNC